MHYIIFFIVATITVVVNPLPVYVIASIGPGCSVTDSVVVDDFHCCEFLPSVFSPNDDGVNDFFYLDAEGARSIECRIYDRWGRELYSWTDVNGHWDGKRYNGTMVDDGVYYYTAAITFVDETSHVYKGFIELMK